MSPKKPRIVYYDVTLHSYREESIFDVTLNGRTIVSGAGPQPRGGGGGLEIGVPFQLGPQTMTWRRGDTGDTVRAANTPVLPAPANGETYLGIHIYPDRTVELIPEQHGTRQTERGAAINKQWLVDHELAVTGCAKPLAALKLSLPDDHMRELIAATDRVLRQAEISLSQGFPRLLPYADRCRSIATLLIEARALGLTRLRDLVRFVGLALVYKERMKTDPHFVALLKRVGARALTLDQALLQWEPISDQPKIITSWTRDVDETPLFN